MTELKYTTLQKTISFIANPPAVRGYVTLCKFCGEGASGVYCKAHGTQQGRKKDFDLQIAILKENKEKGYAMPQSIKNWK